MINKNILKYNFMSKRKKLIIAFLALIVLAGAGFYFYTKSQPEPEPVEVNWHKFLTLDIKSQNLGEEAIKLYQEKFAVLKDRLEKDPKVYRDWISLGILKKGVGDFEGGRDIWLYAKNLDPANSLAWGNLGDLYANFLNEPEKAIECFKHAIELDPLDINYRLGLAEVYRWRLAGKEYLYEQTILEALSAIPNEPNLTLALAAYYKEMGQIDKAIAYYEKVLKLVPDSQEVKQELEELKKNR